MAYDREREYEEKLKRDNERSCIQERIRHVLMSECNNSFEIGENVAVSCAIEGPFLRDAFPAGKSPFFFRKKKEGPTVDARDEYVWEKAELISDDFYGLKFLFPSKKLEKNVVVKIPHFHIERGGIYHGWWGNNILYYTSVWKNVSSNGLIPQELRNLEQVFDYSDIHSLPRENPAGYPEGFPREITDRSCGVGVTVSEDLSLGRSLDSMSREEARSALLANDNIYGLIKALCAVQNPKRSNGIGCSHVLIHGSIDPKTLVVTGAGAPPIVKICNWDEVVAVPFDPRKEDPFIFKHKGKGSFTEGGGIGVAISPYRAPEISKNREGIDTRKLDMFSLAMILFEMLALEGPWYEDPWVQQNLEGGRQGRPEFLLLVFAGNDGNNKRWMDEFISPNLGKAVKAGLGPDIARIIELCCNLDPKMRLAPEEVLDIRPKAVFHIDEEKGRFTITTLQTIEAPRIEAPQIEPIVWSGGSVGNGAPREGNITKKSVLNNVVGASNAINGKGPGAPGGGPGGGPGGN